MLGINSYFTKPDDLDQLRKSTSNPAPLASTKRLAPGVTHRPLGSLRGDKRRWVFGHDATTLGGSSGSPALAWTGTAFGLHFAGRSIDTNCAHAVSAITSELRALGVPIGGLG